MGLLDKAKARQEEHYPGGLLSRAADLSRQSKSNGEEGEKKNSSRRTNRSKNLNPEK